MISRPYLANDYAFGCATGSTAHNAICFSARYGEVFKIDGDLAGMQKNTLYRAVGKGCLG